MMIAHMLTVNVLPENRDCPGTLCSTISAPIWSTDKINVMKQNPNNHMYMNTLVLEKAKAINMVYYSSMSRLEIVVFYSLYCNARPPQNPHLNIKYAYISLLCTRSLTTFDTDLAEIKYHCLHTRDLLPILRKSQVSVIFENYMYILSEINCWLLRIEVSITIHVDGWAIIHCCRNIIGQEVFDCLLLSCQYKPCDTPVGQAVKPVIGFGHVTHQ